MKIKGIIALVVIAFFISFPVDGQNFRENRKGNENNKKEKHGDKHSSKHGVNTIGAPLDGGLLTVLGAAGVAYFVSRKKKKNGEIV